MAGTVLQWSDLARNPRQIAEIVEREGEARIERRGDAQLILLESSRYDAARAHLEVATRLLRNVLAYAGSVEAAVRATFPWTAILPEDGRERFFSEFVDMYAGCGDLGVWAPLDELVREWKATAAIHADPQLLAALRRPIEVDEHAGPVLPPEVPDAEAR